MSPNPTYETEQAADAILRGSLDNRWLKRPQIPDFHIDYLVEMHDEVGPSGQKFGVQLKGTRSPRYVNKDLCFTLETKDLVYYLDKAIDPTFLVVVDVPAKRGVWLFLQEYLKTRAKASWRKQRFLTVRVPKANSLDDLEALRATATKAMAFMRELRPGSVAAAATNLKGELEGLDGRFRVDVGYSAGLTRVTLHAQEEVQGQMRLRTPQAVRKYDELRASGKMVRFEKGDLEMTGSRIFEDLLRRTGDRGIEIRLAKEIECVCTVLDRPATKDEVPLASPLSGLMLAGATQASVAVGIPHSPLSLSFELSVGPPLLLSALSLRFAYEKWVGHDLLCPPSFPHVKRIMAAFVSGRPLGLSCELSGHLVFKGIIEFGDPTPVRHAHALMGLLETAQNVCRHLGMAPRIPDLAHLAQDEDLIRYLGSLIAHQDVATSVKASGIVTCASLATARRVMVGDRGPDDLGLVMTMVDPVPPLLGVAPIGWAIHRQLTRLQLTSESMKLVAEMNEAHQGPIELQVEQSAESVLTTELVKLPADGVAEA